MPFDPNKLEQYKQSSGFDPDKLAAAKAGPPEKPGIFRRAWDALAVPEQMSKEGLGMIASAVPSYEPKGNIVKDIGYNIPKVAAETVAEAAPKFIDRASLASMGLLKAGGAVLPVAAKSSGLMRALGRWGSGWAEAGSGLEYKTPGVLAEAYEDPSLMFGKGRKAVGEMYEAIKDKLKIRPSFAIAGTHRELIDEAMAAAKNGSLTPQEALVARKTLDEAKNLYPSYSYHEIRDTFDNVAKTLSKEADLAFRRAIKSEALRMPLPVNKTGGPSIFKSVLGKILGTVGIPFLSPAAQGVAASGLGATAQVLDPLAYNAVRSGAAVGGVLNPSLEALRRRREQEQP